MAGNRVARWCLVAWALAALVTKAAGQDGGSGYEGFQERYAEYQRMVADYEAWQAYDVKLAEYEAEYDERCACICDRRDVDGNRVQYASCCVSNPDAACTNGPEVCRDLSVCDTTYQYQSQPPKPTKDRVCSRLTECAVGEYESVAPTATSDRQCAPLSAPCPAGQWEKVPDVYKQDRQCFEPSVCSMQEFRYRVHTATADAICQPVTVCKSDEYQVSPPTV